MTNLTYPIILEPLSEEDGGGILASVPDLPGCLADGETPEEALQAVMSAMQEWIEEAKALGRAIPAPSRKAA
jgi:antitoxin HicB